MNDPWKSVLTALEPEIDRLTEAMNYGPLIGTELWKSTWGWSVTLTEQWHKIEVEAWIEDIRFSQEFDRAVEWTVEELKSWPCKRTAYDTWAFKTRRDAEKFITYFSLKWPT